MRLTFNGCWHLEGDIWKATFEKWHLKGDIWKVTFERWHLKGNSKSIFKKGILRAFEWHSNYFKNCLAPHCYCYSPFWILLNFVEFSWIFLNFLEFSGISTKNAILWVPWCFIVLKSSFPRYLRNGLRTHGWMDGRTDKASCRDAWTHLGTKPCFWTAEPISLLVFVLVILSNSVVCNPLHILSSLLLSCFPFLSQS